MVMDNACVAETPGSIFRRAIEHYLRQLKDKKSTKTSFIADCLDPNHSQKPEDILAVIQDIEKKSTKRRKTTFRIMEPVVRALKEFDGVITSLASADPLPSAVIWASLSLIVKGAHRHVELFEKIRGQLGNLNLQLERMREYEDLYGDSENMRSLLCDSYISILRFWSIVEKQCQESVIKGTLKQAFSINTKKLDDVIEEMTDNNDGLARLADIVDARRDKNAREDTRKEWEEAKLERIEARREREANSKFREEQRQEQQDDRYRKLCVWLGSQEANGFNTVRHEVNISDRVGNTCEWLIVNDVYEAWKAGGSSPILWICGPPGSGKTFLCSRAIQDVQESHPTAAVVYHFFHFDRSNDAVVTLKILADRLFQIYWDRHHRVTDELHAKTQRSSFSVPNVQEIILALVQTPDFPDVFFILDGLDEEIDDFVNSNSKARWQAAQSVVDFVAGLVNNGSGKVRLWCSSQEHHRIHELLEKHSPSVIDIRNKAKDDVQSYLLSKLKPLLDKLEIPPLEGPQMLVQLTVRAKEEANFLWARFMVSDLQESADDLEKFKAFITIGHPSNMNDQYAKIISRIDSWHRQLACEVFALVAFARRPLRVKEIREAVGILRNAHDFESSMPFTVKVKSIFSPLIETSKTSENDSIDDYTCRLFHSTARCFLINHPEILKWPDAGILYTSPCVQINPDAIASACLHYLSQPRYSTPLFKREDGEWCDGLGSPVRQHRFLIYSAKYWDKHLDNIPLLDKPLEFQKKVKEFVTSPNFQACIQVQNLWVGSQFDTFVTETTQDKKFIRRVLPEWFRDTAEFVVFFRNYRLFLREWRTFLWCTRCEIPGCVLHPYAGQVDRCWWAALGRSNFLSKLPGRYTSFAFAADDDVNTERGKGFLCEGVCALGNSLKILRLQSHDRDTGSLTFICEFWTVNGTCAPTLVKQQTILTNETSTKWLTYPSSVDQQSRSVSALKVNMSWASPASFSQDCSSLRLGAQLYTLDETGSYRPTTIYGVDTKANPSPQSADYFEEWAVQGDYVVLATRSKAPASAVKSNHSEPKEGTSSENDHSDDSDEGEISSDEEETSSEEGDQGYETWSECSSEHPDDFIFEDDIITPWAGPESGIDSETGESESDDDTSSDEDRGISHVSLEDPTEADKDDEESDTGSEAESEVSYVPPSAITGYGLVHNDDEDWLWDIEHGSPLNRLGRSSRAQAPPDKMYGTITVLDTRLKDKPRVFRFSQPLRYALHDSPPVLHPTSTLLVWPLSCGDVLFADYLANTYFTRRIRPSTSYTRHVFMKCRFSPCGRYLHVVSLEGRLLPKKRKDEEDVLKLALMVSTYHLCQRQVSRSPPTLIHRARVSLGSVSSLRVSNLPFTLTWDPSKVYLTFAGVQRLLKVYRIDLFNPNVGDPDGTIPSVFVPKERILLPDTARQRKVYFFPSNQPSTHSHRILIGSEIHAPAKNDKTQEDELEIKEYLGEDFCKEGQVLSPPVGCYIKDSDLGEWIETTDQSKLPGDLGIGQFDRLMEEFNPEDDCDLEPLLF